jgi:hypothetical protein
MMLHMERTQRLLEQFLVVADERNIGAPFSGSP